VKAHRNTRIARWRLSLVVVTVGALAVAVAAVASTTKSSAVTLTALIALGHHDEQALHLRGALRNGLTREEIKEVLLQAAVYCGVPAGNAAFRVAQRVFDELEQQPNPMT